MVVLPCCPSRHEPARSQGLPIPADNFPNELARLCDSVGKSLPEPSEKERQHLDHATPATPCPVVRADSDNRAEQPLRKGRKANSTRRQRTPPPPHKGQALETFYSPSRPPGRPSYLCPHHKGASPPLPAREGVWPTVLDGV